ncbi:hypothetical protein AWW66_28555 [Micromonospora rosaria]|uniref:ABC3 transporter permease C-terminal domain-containing protein n=1 Tax=Micromonospora rosaria TaxID=47874 RepID=A0A136PJT4_9ACTN|nr:ABC transporter permease [Micromonospora rosaria]KXK58657.1 hypothetical protein AWW66_28555 [Micromonospora rosaria]
MSAPAARRRAAPARWAAELALGARLSVSGGRSGWARLLMVAVGVGLGVAMLLVVATVPTVVAARGDRLAARDLPRDEVPRGDDTLLVGVADSEFRDRPITGRLVQPEGARAPLPPGVDRLPAPGELVASPALARLLDSPDGALLRDRWDARVVATIGDAGLSGPEEYAFYLGTDRLTEADADRIRSFGRSGGPDDGLAPALLLLAVVGLVVLLVPVAIFVSSAARFGGEARDRQLAALRLVGADATMIRRIAAGETVTGALLGLVVGGLIFVAVGLPANRFLPPGLSVFPADLRPAPALAVLVAVVVPVLAVLVTVSALRRVVVEPLGVVRRGDQRRRRLWWRLVLPVVGLVLLYPLRDGFEGRSAGFEYQVTAGLALLLTGVALVLPWLVDATVRRIGGGGVAWQLAVRRLQLDSGTAVRTVSGIAVSVAGAIALQGLVGAVQAQYTEETGRDTDRYQAVVLPRGEVPDARWTTTLAQLPQVTGVGTVRMVWADPAQADATRLYARVRVGDCAVLRQFARIDACADGDTFVVDESAPPGPGDSYTLGDTAGAPHWTLPATTRTVPKLTDDPLLSGTNILVTPAALGGGSVVPDSVEHYLALDTADPDAIERVRNAAAVLDPGARVRPTEWRPLDDVLLTIRQVLLVGATALLLLVGASMLVNVAEQLRERRRLLAVLVAFGTRRRTLTGSVLYQVAIPVLLGLSLAVATGTGLSMLLQVATDSPVRFDWSGIGLTSGAAALVVLATTGASLPLLWRLTRPAGLRSE